MEFIILASLGATLIVTRSKLFRPLRELLKLSFFRCDQCCGFWLGGGIGFFYTDQKEVILIALSTSALGFLFSKLYPPLKGKVPNVAPTLPESDIMSRINNLEMEI